MFHTNFPKHFLPHDNSFIETQTFDILSVFRTTYKKFRYMYLVFNARKNYNTWLRLKKTYNRHRYPLRAMEVVRGVLITSWYSST